MAEFIEKEKLVAGLDKTLKNIPSFPSDPIGRELVALGIETVIKTVKALPAADVRPVVRARWVERHTNIGTPNVCYFSSCCGFPSWYGKLNFCPNCGADMREES